MTFNVLRYIAYKDADIAEFDYSTDFRRVAKVATVSSEDAYHQRLSELDLRDSVILLDFQWELASSILSNGPTVFTCRALDVLQTTRERHPESKIVITAALLHISDLLPLYRQGVMAIVPKHNFPKKQLVQALRSASEGKPFIVEQITRAQTNYVLGVLDPVFSGLSDDELEVVEMIINEHKTESIREAMNSTSIPAVRNKISKILKHIGVPTRPDLIDRAIAIGMVVNSD